MSQTFAKKLRSRRLQLRKSRGPAFSLRQVAYRIEVQPSYLSRIERGETPPPSEEKILLLAEELDLDHDELLALAGKVASDLQETICKRPRLFGGLIRELSDAPDDGIRLLTDRAEQGDW